MTTITICGYTDLMSQSIDIFSLDRTVVSIDRRRRRRGVDDNTAERLRACGQLDNFEALLRAALIKRKHDAAAHTRQAG